MTESPRTLLLPVETVARELDGKLLLALIARERGWNVYLGDQTVIREHATSLPRGVFLSKSARSKNAKAFRHMHQLGHGIAVLDEEALVRQTDDIYLMKHEKDALKYVSLLMAWGEENRLLWVNSGRCEPEMVQATGNPRVDMLRADLRAYHKPEIDDIHARFGDYVLFNGNFSTVNHFIPGRSRFGLASWVPAEERERHTSKLLEHKRRLFEGFLALLPKVAKALAPITLVIRPHPSEDHLPWKEAISGHDNVVVTFEGSVVPWLAGARALIHNGCTTAVEAAVIGTTALCYRPVKSDTLDNPLPNGLSVECDTDEALLAALADVIANGARPLTAAQEATLDFFLTGRKGKLSCEHIVDALELSGLGRGRAQFGRGLTRLKVFLRQQPSRLKRHIAWVYARGRSRMAYRERKFPELTSEFLNARVDRFRRALGRFEQLGARQVRPRLFVID